MAPSMPWQAAGEGEAKGGRPRGVAGRSRRREGSGGRPASAHGRGGVVQGSGGAGRSGGVLHRGGVGAGGSGGVSQGEVGDADKALRGCEER